MRVGFMWRVGTDCRAVVLARCRFVSHARIDRLYFMTDVAEMIQVRTPAELPACGAHQFNAFRGRELGVLALLGIQIAEVFDHVPLDIETRFIFCAAPVRGSGW